jgi:endonuclease/exonuclease/phosphatase (EEP) superfamily protein YafD
MVSPVAQVLARWSWRADLLTHFRHPACTISILAAALIARWRRAAAFPFIFLATLQALSLLQFAGRNPVPPSPASSARIRVLAANVLHTNTDFDPLIRLIREEKPDVIGLVEFSERWKRALARARLELDYPYRIEWPGEGHGLALYFRRPPRSIGALQHPFPRGNPAVNATIGLDGRILTIWLLHPTSPLAKLGRSRGRPEAMALAQAIAGSPDPRLVIGDLNRTEGSPIFSDFLRTTGLRDSRLGFGRQPTWPAWSPYRIAIDHALVSSELAVVARRVGPPIGSDHLPLIVDIAPAWTSAVRNRSTHGVQSSP